MRRLIETLHAAYRNGCGASVRVETRRALVLATIAVILVGHALPPPMLHPEASPPPCTRPYDSQVIHCCRADCHSRDCHHSENAWACRVTPLSFAAAVVGFLIAADQLCLEDPLLWSCRCLAYLGLTVGIAGFTSLRYFQHKSSAHRSRLEDESEVRASIVEAKTVQPRLLDPLRPERFDEKKEDLDKEIQRLEALGPERWTEYELLSLYQMLVDFLKPSDLRSTTDSVMDVVEEYAGDSRFRYDRDYYAKWKKRVDDAVDAIGDAQGVDADNKCERLRAVLKTLYDHVADFNLKWAEGSALIRDLLFVNAAAIPAFLLLGLVPAIHPSDSSALGIFNWAMLAVAGALAGSLRGLHASDVVEVGNTEGKQEIWRACSGAALGFVAGVLTYGVIVGQLVVGAAVPTADGTTLSDVGLSVVWGVAAGFSFERVFERVRTATEGAN